MHCKYSCTRAVTCNLTYICSSSFRGLSDVCNAHCLCTVACLGHYTTKTNVTWCPSMPIGSLEASCRCSCRESCHMYCRHNASNTCNRLNVNKAFLLLFHTQQRLQDCFTHHSGMEPICCMLVVVFPFLSPKLASTQLYMSSSCIGSH